jgi:hypothetical protein
MVKLTYSAMQEMIAKSASGMRATMPSIYQRRLISHLLEAVDMNA